MRRADRDIARKFNSSKELREYVIGIDSRVHVAFSCGKDAIAAFLALREHHGVELSCHYSYLIPGLSFVDEWIAYYERKLHVKIHQVPNPSLFRLLSQEVFQTPDRGPAFRESKLAEFSIADMHDYARKVSGAEGAYIATGVRSADSPIRRTSIAGHGSLNPATKTFAAIYDWKIADVCDAIQRSGLKLPVDYLMFGRSFDGIDFRFLSKIRDRFPADYDKILEFFPLADLEIKRRSLCPRAR